MKDFLKKHITSILIILLCGFCGSPDCLALEIDRDGEAVAVMQTETPPAPAESADIAEKIDFIRLYFVDNGKVQNSVFTGKELAAGKPLRVDGYVCGVIALCKDEMDISIAGRRMNKIWKNADGTISIKNFGQVGAKGPALVAYDESTDEAPSTNRTVDPKSEAFLAGGYSYFPKVAGDILSPDSEFDIVFAAGGKACRVAVSHEGAYTVRAGSRSSKAESAYARFRYLGTRLDNLREQTADFELRLDAISKGIESVESAFSVELVDKVNIVDCESMRGAVASDGRSDIWIYLDAFLNESAEELTTIAAHEALHILVDKTRLTRDSEVRELFAYLRGYDAFSRERFSIVTSGLIPPGEPGQGLKSGVFFAFINEENFIEGMNGGHSHKSIEEFCVSFIHSLMFFDRFETNLERPMRLPGKSDEWRLLTPVEREFIVENYLKAVDILIHALPTADKQLAQTGLLLRDSLDRAGQILKERTSST